MANPDQEQIDLYESKAKWCDANGLPADAAQHRAHVAQLKKKEVVPRNWNRDGWTELDWQTVEVYSRALTKAASDLDNGVGGGGGGFTPHDLLDLADRADLIAKRLRELAKNYF